MSGEIDKKSISFLPRDDNSPSNAWKWNLMQSNFKLLLPPHYNGNQISRTDGTACQNKLQVSIGMSREFMWSDQLGFNWHKTWNLPVFQVTVTSEAVRSSCSNLQHAEQAYPGADMLRAELHSVKHLEEFEASSHAKQAYFEEVGLIGTTKEQLQDAKCTFDGIKFKETTYNIKVG